MRAVNLMPRDERKARLETGRLPLLVAGGGVVLVTALAFFLGSSASSSQTEAESELQAVEATIQALPKGSESSVSVGELVQERSNRTTALASALASRVAFDRVLREISYVFPKNAWLTKLEATAPDTSELPVDDSVPQPQAVAATGVTIEGATFSHEAVATVLSRLSVVPSLSGVTLTSTSLVEPQAPEGEAAKRPRGKPFVTFVVSAAVKTGGAS